VTRYHRVFLDTTGIVFVCQAKSLIPIENRVIPALAQQVTLGQTLQAWSEEIVCMCRFTCSNGITEGLHKKMEAISRRAYGFRNFENFRQRVLVLCA
jgi:transposase